jgi:hypothetical protein
MPINPSMALEFSEYLIELRYTDGLTPGKYLESILPFTFTSEKSHLGVLSLICKMILSKTWVSVALCAAAVFQSANATPKPLKGEVSGPNQRGEQQTLNIAEWSMAALTHVD